MNLKFKENQRGETRLLNNFTYFNIKGENENGVYGIVEICGKKNGNFSPKLFEECKSSIYLNCKNNIKCPSKIFKNVDTLFYTIALSKNNINELLKVIEHGILFINNKILNTPELKKKYSTQLQLKTTPHVYPGLTNSIFHIHFYLLKTPYADLSDSELTNKSFKDVISKNKLINNLITNGFYDLKKYVFANLYELLII
jgi:hypothetical protein